MLTTPFKLPRLSLVILLLAAPAAAQLDIPKKKTGGSGAQAPRRGKGGLDLPRGKGGDLAPTPGGEPDKLNLPAKTEADLLEAPVYDSTPVGAASYIFDQLDGVDDPDSSIALSAVTSLGALGQEGVTASRMALWEREAAGIVTAARVIVRFGGVDDRRAVMQRFEDRVPARASTPLLATVLAADPVLATPEFLIGLLEHPTSSMRTSAQRALDERVDASSLTLLAVHLGSKRAHTRQLALDLIGDVDDPSVRLLISSRLGDSTAKVAIRAAELLAGLEDPEVAPMLLERVFDENGIDRERAYGLMSLIQREDRRREVLITEDHVPELLVGLRSGEIEIVTGACAAALAGVGFRSEVGIGGTWLDRDVPHTLVRLSSGAVFHPDFSALQPTALSRLSLITGQNFGRNGPAWQNWWTENAEGFQARRAFLAIRTEEATLLRVSYLPDMRRDVNHVMVGASRGVDEAGESAIYMTPRQCERLLGSLRSSGMLSSERMPTRLGGSGIPGRAIEIDINGQSKRFEIALGAIQPWFSEVENTVLDLAQENRWQDFHDGTTPRHAFWAAESEWWENEASATERGRRLKQLLLKRLGMTSVRQRNDDIEELERIYKGVGVPEPADFSRFTELLDDEEFFASRAEALVNLAMVAAATTGTPPRPAGATIEPELGRTLFELITARFGEDARAAAERVLIASGRDEVRRVAESPMAFRRSLAPRGLAKDPEAADIEALLTLLDDPIETVEVSAVRAIGDARLDAGREPLFQRARTGSPVVRAAALRAAGRLGGEEVMNLCILGLAEEDKGIQSASALALADLADPESASLLASLFARGPESHFFQPSREGLKRLGQAAWPELLRLTTSGAVATRREAALLLAEEGVPEACSTLFALLTQYPDDDRVAWELAVLTCVDFRTEEQPSAAWWAWWDLVVHDDSLAWLRAAGVREGLQAPTEGALESGGTREGALFLYTMMQLDRPHLVERSRRELERLLGSPLEAPPASGQPRRQWLADTQLEIDESF